jgi:hypothetical protein
MLYTAWLQTALQKHRPQTPPQTGLRHPAMQAVVIMNLQAGLPHCTPCLSSWARAVELLITGTQNDNAVESRRMECIQ